jgi:hypothetical protein
VRCGSDATDRARRERRGARDRAGGLSGGRLLLDACSGLGADALLVLGGPLRRTAGPLAQPLQLAGLGEDQQRQHRDPQQRGEGRDRADLGDRAR